MGRELVQINMRINTAKTKVMVVGKGNEQLNIKYILKEQYILDGKFAKKQENIERY